MMYVPGVSGFVASETWLTLRRLASAARVSNPVINAVDSTTTLTETNTADGTLTNTYRTFPDYNTYYGLRGGTATKFPNQQWLLFPVSSVAPSTSGGLSGYLTATPSLSAWTWEVEFMTDALVVEIKYLVGSSQSVNVIVDNQFVSTKTGTTPGGSGTRYVKLDFAAARQARHIRFRSRGAAGFGGVAIAATANIWPPDSGDVVKVAFTGDSYSEGLGLSTSVNPDGTWVHVCSHYLGWRDPRQVAVGSTGYIASASGARSTIRNQIPNWGFTPDVIVCAAGYNDTSYSVTTVTDEAKLAWRAMRNTAPNAPIFVLGPWGGRRGPDAATLALEAALQSAVSQFADPMVVFIPVSTAVPPWLFGTGYTGATNSTGNSDLTISSDATHPTDHGHSLLGRRAAEAIYSAIVSRS